MFRVATAPFLSAAAAVLVAAPAAGQTLLGQPLSGGFVLRPGQPADPAVVPLPTEDPSTGRVEREQPLPGVAPTDDLPTASLPPVRRPTADPYEPLGIRAGSFILYPSLTTTLGQTTNAEGAAGGGAGTFVILSPELSLRSDWTRHEATFELSGSFQHFVNGAADDRPKFEASGTGRLDASDMWTVPLSADYAFTTQAISDPDFPAGVDSPPGVHDLKGSIGVDRTGPAMVQAEAKVQRTIYENGMSGGLVVDQGDRTNTVIGARLRLGYAVTPSLAPFVEGELARREFDRTVDGDGLRRSGDLRFLRAGIAVDRGPILTGELALGFGIATFDDPALSSIRTFTADGNAVWSPTALTTVTLNAATTLNPSTDPASAGSAIYDASADLAYAWRTNVTLDAKLAARHERFQGTGEIETDATAKLGATWKLNRMLWLTGAYEHEWLTSTVPGRAFQSDAVRVELKAQR